MGPNEIARAPPSLAYRRPASSRIPELQEKLFERYTLDHYKLLMRDPMFAGLSIRTSSRCSLRAARRRRRGALPTWRRHGGQQRPTNVSMGERGQASPRCNERLRTTTPTVAADYPRPRLSLGHGARCGAQRRIAGGAGTPVEIHVHRHFDGKSVAHSVQKHVVKSNSQIYGPSMHDKLWSLSTPDAGYQTER